MSKRTFKDFLASSGTEGVKRVALDYATEDDTVTLETIAEKYNMSTKSIKKLFEYAIVNCLVSFQTAKSMQMKAHRNQTRHLKEEPQDTPSDKYYRQLFTRRIDYVKQLEDSKVKEIVDIYIKSPQLTAFAVAESVGLSKKELNIILRKAIIFNIVDDETVKKMCSVSLMKTPDYRESGIVSELFRQYKELRILYVTLTNRICQMYFQLEAYSGFISSESDNEIEYSITELRKQLKIAEKELERFKSRF